jgi:hypothetical protein
LHPVFGNPISQPNRNSNADQRKAAWDLFAEGEPGFGLSACEYLASRDIALTIGDTSALAHCSQEASPPMRHRTPARRRACPPQPFADGLAVKVLPRLEPQ